MVRLTGRTMIQAQPLPPTGDRGRSRPGRSGAIRSVGPGATRPGGRSTQLASDDVKGMTVRRSLLRRRWLPFTMGIAVGYGLAGPLPALVGGATASLPQNTAPLTKIVSPFQGIGGRRILVMGMDRVGDNTDVIFTVQVKNGSTRITQVPRDTFVDSERFGVLKANALYAYGGMESAKQELGTLLDVPLQRYLRVNLRAVERLADALGGVEIDVPKRMYYLDNAQGLYIDLYPGPQLLQGETLEGFLRFRHDERGDLGRMERQQLVLKQVFTKLTQPAMLTRLPELLRIAGEDVDTDLSPVEMGQLISAMASTELDATQLPGRLFWHNDLSFWMPDSNLYYGQPMAVEAY